MNRDSKVNAPSASPYDTGQTNAPGATALSRKRRRCYREAIAAEMGWMIFGMT